MSRYKKDLESRIAPLPGDVTRSTQGEEQIVKALGEPIMVELNKPAGKMSGPTTY